MSPLRCFGIISHVSRNYPIGGINTDGASHFITQRHYSYRVNLKYDYGPTQIQRALNELGVRLIIAGSP
ncbi:hypothetical protein MYX76_01635 [Desulfobacterota bacterium AH_259_B03_O07]|nr:hypothetical protein [Desulfobacterota bacterium AH_259_B03_O07]